jgi:hypothetical protein
MRHMNNTKKELRIILHVVNFIVSLTKLIDWLFKWMQNWKNLFNKYNFPSVHMYSVHNLFKSFFVWFLPLTVIFSSSWEAIRVTRLGEFSPIGNCSLWADLFKLQKRSKFWGYFHGKSYFIILTKNGIGNL